MNKFSIDNSYQTTTIKEIITETPQVKTFILDTKIKAQPGQYLMVWIPRINEKPFGIASTNPLMLSIANVGPFSQKMHELKEGDKISFRGPYGTSFTPKGNNILIVAGGYGVVPLYFLASSYSEKTRNNITIVIGAKNKTFLPYIQKFKDLNCNVKVSTDDGSEGFKGYSTDLAQNLLDQEKFDQVYTCGPVIMMEKIAQICDQKNIPCELSFEAYFKCGGLGLCGECNYKGILTCQKGPVFDSKFLLK